MDVPAELAGATEVDPQARAISAQDRADGIWRQRLWPASPSQM